MDCLADRIFLCFEDVLIKMSLAVTIILLVLRLSEKCCVFTLKRDLCTLHFDQRALSVIFFILFILIRLWPVSRSILQGSLRQSSIKR